jgi:hypothetical protein
VKVRRFVIGIVHLHDDTEETADLGHARTIVARRPTSLIVNPLNGIPGLRTQFRIDSERVLLPGLGKGNLTSAFQRGVGVTNPAAHPTAAAAVAVLSLDHSRQWWSS